VQRRKILFSAAEGADHRVNIKSSFAMTTQATLLNDFSQAERQMLDRSPASRAAPAKSKTTDPRQARKPRRWLGLAISLTLVSAAAAAGWYYYQEAAKFETTDDAFVEADVHPISSRVAGDVIEVLVSDNQAVKKGDPLAKLDPRDFDLNVGAAEAALAGAAAQVPQAEATLAQSQAALRQAEALITSADADLAKARLDLDRVRAIQRTNSGAISAQNVDAAKAAADAANGASQGALAGRDAATAAVASAEANLAAAKAAKDQAQAALDTARQQQSYTVLTAPTDGRIAKKTVQSGQHVQPGQALMAVVSPDEWIVANFKENQLANMQPNQKVDIEVDAIGGHVFQGHVESFAPGTGAKFSLLPPDNATGNFTKIVQRVPVKILLTEASAKDYQERLAPGLSASVKVRIHD
jgi:membrane fusion protein (multidrug efflux system)